MAASLLALVFAGCQSVQPSPPSTSTKVVVALPSASAADSIATASPLPLGTGEITARYDDGLPSVVGGVPVLRGQAAIDFAAAQMGATPFLVTGWVDYEGGTRYCTLGVQPERYSWRSDCGRAAVADLAGSRSPELTDAITFHYALDGLHTGPFVAVVGVHDPRALDCGSEVRSTCDAMMVVQRVPWSGDAATAAGPHTPAEVRQALAGLDLPGEMGNSCTQSPWLGCGVEPLINAEVYPFLDEGDIAPAVIAVYVEPTVAARQRALPRADGVDAALTKGAIVLHSGGRNGFGAPWVWQDERWLVVDNVAILVWTHSPATATDREFMERLVAALHAVQ